MAEIIVIHKPGNDPHLLAMLSISEKISRKADSEDMVR